MCGNSTTTNHSLWCTSNIWKLTLAIKVLNRWLKSHMDSISNCFIFLIAVMHCDSNLGFMNSQIIVSHISSRVLCGIPTGTMQKFMNQSSMQTHKVVIICTLFMSALWIGEPSEQLRKGFNATLDFLLRSHWMWVIWYLPHPLSWHRGCLMNNLMKEESPTHWS